MNDLAPADTALRGTYILIVKKGLTTFYEVGTALKQLHDRKLYLSSHDNFEDFCREEFDMTRAYAHRLIAAAQVVDNIKEVSPVVYTPEAESHARPLASVPEEDQGIVWQEVVATAPAGKVTAEHVRETVAKHNGPAAPKPPKSGPAPIFHEIIQDFDRLELKIDGACEPHPHIAGVREFMTKASELFSRWVKETQR